MTVCFSNTNDEQQYFYVIKFTLVHIFIKFILVCVAYGNMLC